MTLSSHSSSTLPLGDMMLVYFVSHLPWIGLRILPKLLWSTPFKFNEKVRHVIVIWTFFNVSKYSMGSLNLSYISTYETWNFGNSSVARIFALYGKLVLVSSWSTDGNATMLWVIFSYLSMRRHNSYSIFFFSISPKSVSLCLREP